MKQILVEARSGVHTAAGALVLAADTKKFLFGLRSYAVDDPAVWGTFGGGVDEGETLTTAIRRELREEAGYRGSFLRILPLWTSRTPEVHYHNFLAVVPSQFKPVLNWETTISQWVRFDRWPKPLHPGVKNLLADPRSMQTIEEILSGL